MLWSIFTIAQSNTKITGIVKDAKTGKVISDVSIITDNLAKGTVTDSNGNYTITVPINYKILRFSKIGFETLQKNINASTIKQPLVIFLKKKDIALDEISISSNQKVLKQQILNVGKLPVKDIDAPITTNSIDAKILQLRNVTDLGDAVKSATGVRPINRYGGFQTFRIRGFNNFVLLVDGVRDERHNISTSAPTTNLANVEQIEVLKGPASVLYGHSALGGIINIVRKKPNTTTQGSFNISYGSFDTYNVNTGFGGAISSKLRYRADFGITRTNGWRDYGVATNNGSFTFEYTPTDKDTFEFYVQANNDKYDTDTGIPVDDDGSLVPGMNPETRYNDPQDYLKHKRFDFQLKYTHSFSTNFKLTNHLSYSDDDIDYLSTEFLEFNSTKDQLTRSFPFYFNHQTKTLQNQLDLSYTTLTGNIKHKLLLGNSVSYLDRKTFRGSVVGPGTFTTISIQNPILNQGFIEPLDERVDVTDETVSGFYVQDWLEFSNQVKALIGLRYDIFEGTYYRDAIDDDRNIITNGDRTNIPSNAFTYRAGLVYQPIKNTLSFFGSYSNYFKPSRRIAPDGTIFNPEKGYQIESGFKFNKSRLLTTTVSIFYMLKNNIVERTSVDDFQQIGEADSKGFEIDVELQPIDGLYVKTGYAFVDAKVRSYNETLQTITPGNQLRFAPKNTANFWVNYDFHMPKLKGIGIGLGGNYVGDNYTNSSNTFELPAYTTLDGTIYYQAKKVRIGFNLNNITDELYFTDAIYGRQFFVGQGRNYKVNITYKF